MSSNGIQPKVNGSVAPADPVPVTPGTATDDCLEAIAKSIETLTATATLQVGEELAKARDIFRYRKDEGGFAGWVESRLHYSRSTAYNLISVFEQFGGQEVSKCLDTLGRSVLFLISAPSTPPEARTAVLEHAKNGERLTHAQVKEVVDTAKGHKPPNRTRAILRELKLGADTIAKLKGTTLGKAKEQDELVFLNRRAAPGTLAPIVQQLIAAAVAGKPVSAVHYTKSWGARRGAGIDAARIPGASVFNPVSTASSARARKGETAGITGADEIERLRACVDELAAEKRQLEIRIEGYKDELAHVRSIAHPAEQLSLEQLLDLLERRLGERKVDVYQHLQKIRKAVAKAPPPTITAEVETLH
jgi:DUF3102 family protein